MLAALVVIPVAFAVDRPFTVAVGVDTTAWISTTETTEYEARDTSSQTRIEGLAIGQDARLSAGMLFHERFEGAVVLQHTSLNRDIDSRSGNTDFSTDFDERATTLLPTFTVRFPTETPFAPFLSARAGLQRSSRDASTQDSSQTSTSAAKGYGGAAGVRYSPHPVSGLDLSLDYLRLNAPESEVAFSQQNDRASETVSMLLKAVSVRLGVTVQL